MREQCLIHQQFNSGRLKFMMIEVLRAFGHTDSLP